MSINPLRQRHSTGVPDDFLYHRGRYFLFSKHGNAGVASIVRLVRAAYEFHDRRNHSSSDSQNGRPLECAADTHSHRHATS